MIGESNNGKKQLPDTLVIIMPTDKAVSKITNRDPIEGKRIKAFTEVGNQAVITLGEEVNSPKQP